MERKEKELRLKKLIDKAGQLKERIEKLQSKFQVIRSEIISLCEELGIDSASGDEYTCLLTPNTKMIVDPVKLYEKVGDDVFFKVITVQVTKLDKFIPRHKVSEIAKFETKGYRVTLQQKK